VPMTIGIRASVRALALGLCALLLPWTASALAPEETVAQGTQQPATQQTASPPGVVRIFLDCNYACDETFIRSDITFVDYMRDRTDADVHVLITTEDTGGGGTEYTLKFIGLARFAGTEQTLRHVTPQTATSDERRRSMTEVLKQGLVRYVSESPVASRLKITLAPDAGAKGQTTPAADPWNLWVFRTEIGGSLNGEQSSSGKSMRGSASANRTTEAWKLNVSVSTNYRESRFDLGDGETFRSVTQSFDSRGLAAKSLGAHWAAALTVQASASSFLNQDLRTRVAPGIEYNIFPYAENTRRRLTLQYTVGLSTYDYNEETIYGKLSEQLPDHRLRTTLSMRQPWGNAYAAATFSQFLSDPGKYSISTFGETSVRLFKGFSLDVFGEVSRTRDQIYLQRGSATTEEILVQQRQLATGYQYYVSFGISYSFGSIFNNVVNPRFEGF
jgi:hypothetical protein